MKEITKLEELRLHERIVYCTDQYKVYITRVPKGLIYIHEFYAKVPYVSSVFVPFEVN